MAVEHIACFFFFFFFIDSPKATSRTKKQDLQKPDMSLTHKSMPDSAVSKKSKDPISTTPKEKSTLRKRSPGLSKLTSATLSHCWVSTLGLTDGHRKIIEKGKWLEGDHIGAAGKVLRQQFKDKINGLQDPGKAENPSLFIPQSSDPTIQIHHNGTNHLADKYLQKGSGAAVRQQMA